MVCRSGTARGTFIAVEAPDVWQKKRAANGHLAHMSGLESNFAFSWDSSRKQNSVLPATPRKDRQTSHILAPADQPGCSSNARTGLLTNPPGPLKAWDLHLTPRDTFSVGSQLCCLVDL